MLTGVFVFAYFSTETLAFDDVRPGMTYFKAIDFLKSQGVVEGYADGSFGYHNAINRAEFLALVFKAGGIDTGDFNKCFPDANGEWFEKYVCTAFQKGWVHGYADGKFKGSNNVNFVEALKIAFEALNIDYSKSDPWYLGLINKANERGVNLNTVNGPGDYITRAEAAAIIAGIYDPSLLDDSGNFSDLFEGEVFDGSTVLDVPFTSQAPFKNWTVPYDEACEEAVLIMAKAFLNGEELSVSEANQMILDLTGFVADGGYKVDVSVAEMAQIAKDYFGISSEIFYGDMVTEKNIKKLVDAGYPVILPVAGRLLFNPHFIGAGPPYHTILVIGYDENGFITHDPGTQFGNRYHYSYDVIENAIHDFTGDRSTILQGQRAMLVLGV